MSFLKFQPLQLFTGTQVLNAGHVLITSEAGIVEGIVPAADAGDNVKQVNGILSPGFVNAHCHLELSHLRGLIPEKTGLVDFVYSVVTQRNFPENEIMMAIEKAENEMLINGIVAAGDICNNSSTLLQKQKQRIAYYNFIEVSGWLPQIAATRFEKSKKFYDEFALLSSFTSLVPHAPYSVSEKLWKLMAPSFRGKTISIHNQETAFEDEFFLRGKGDFTRMYGLMGLDNSFFQPPGKTSLQYFLGKMEDADHILLVHNTFTTEEDIQFTKRTKAKLSWCLCVNANQYIEGVLPQIELLRKQQCDLIIGTDSLASNHGLSILGELKTIQHHFPHIPLGEILQWATLNGAKALGMQDRFGSFENGKRPGILLIEGVRNGGDLSTSTVTRLL